MGFRVIAADPAQSESGVPNFRDAGHDEIGRSPAAVKTRVAG